MDQISNHKPRFEKIFSHFQEELSTLRTGRAHPAVVENILVSAYNTTTKLKQLASISVPDARTLVIEPWDKNIIKDIEKAMVNANLGLAPANEGTLLRITLPPLTEEDRRDMIRIIGQKVEQARIAVRQVRDDIKEEIIHAEHAKEITEDEKYTLFKKLDDLVSDANERLKKLTEHKEEEILTV